MNTGKEEITICDECGDHFCTSCGDDSVCLQCGNSFCFDCKWLLKNELCPECGEHKLNEKV